MVFRKTHLLYMALLLCCVASVGCGKVFISKNLSDYGDNGKAIAKSMEAPNDPNKMIIEIKFSMNVKTEVQLENSEFKETDKGKEYLKNACKDDSCGAMAAIMQGERIAQLVSCACTITAHSELKFEDKDEDGRREPLHQFDVNCTMAADANNVRNGYSVRITGFGADGFASTPTIPIKIVKGNS